PPSHPRTPTRRSSDLLMARRLGGNVGYAVLANQLTHRTAWHRAHLREHVILDHESATQAIENLTSRLASAGLPFGQDEDSALKRSEEHTCELQSRVEL